MLDLEINDEFARTMPQEYKQDCKENKSSYLRNKFGYGTEKLEGGWAVLGKRITIKESKDILVRGNGCVE